MIQKKLHHNDSVLSQVFQLNISAILFFSLSSQPSKPHFPDSLFFSLSFLESVKFIVCFVQILTFSYFSNTSLQFRVSYGKLRTEIVKNAEIDSINCTKNHEKGTIITQITNLGSAFFNSHF